MQYFRLSVLKAKIVVISMKWIPLYYFNEKLAFYGILKPEINRKLIDFNSFFRSF
jgi:hypothetical protein